MKYSTSFIKTQKSGIRGADTIGTENLIRSGFIYKLSSGLYSFLPLGYKVLKKIEKIINQELAKKGVQNVLTPVIQPAIFWKESGRYKELEEELWKTKNRFDEEYILAMTAEELFSDMVRKNINSYRDLPIILNQFQTKIRDEIRPKGGLMRVREFIMQDAYSFDIDEKSMSESHNKIFDAYKKIFARIGINAMPVKADVGAMGGKESWEFVAINNSGEDKIAICDKCDYKANLEIAECLVKPDTEGSINKKEKEIVKTPSMITVSEVSEYLNLPEKKVLKSVVYKLKKSNKIIMVIIRGDLQINESKLLRFLEGKEFEVASEKDLDNLGLTTGFISPLEKNNKIQVIADNSVKTMYNFVAGANEPDSHFLNVNVSDLFINKWQDLAQVSENSKCPKCGGNIKIKKVIELGHTFKLGTRYSESMKIIFKDQKGDEQLAQMGCYGIGLGRLMQVCAELFSDENGIAWPKAIAPYKFYLIDLENKKAADEVYKNLIKNKQSVLYDDRETSPGTKFMDADLIGCPYRITISKRTLSKDSLEIKERKTGKTELVKIDDFYNKMQLY